MTFGTVRLKNVAGVVVSNVDKHSTDGEPAVKLCNYVDVYKNTYIDSNLPFMDSTASEEQVRRYSLRANDVIITKDSETPFDIAVPALVTEDIPGLVCGYHLAVIRANTNALNPRFLLRAFQAKTTASYFATSANGITRYGLTYHSLKNVPLPLPPISEQERIANFLDRETAEADALVAKYERLIELLEEKRVALITQAVTKGLDPTVPMKDSRVEWIGDIPAHWRVIRLKLTTDSLQTGPFGTVFQSNEYISEGIPMINPTHFADGLIRPSTEHTVSRGTALRLSRYAMLQGDVLYARRGDTKKYGLVKLTQNGWVCGSDVIRVRVKRDRISPDFLAAYTASTAGQEFLMHSANGTTMDGINPSQLGNLSVPIPPTAEQSLIVESIALACNDFENIKKSAAMAVSLALERRSALITAAVIGQIDVAAYRPKQQAQELPA